MTELLRSETLSRGGKSRLELKLLARTQQFRPLVVNEN